MAMILVVDDDGAMRHVLREAVIDLGHEACVAESGAAALALMSGMPIDAALIDLRMPGMDGLQLLTRMRESGRAPPIAVLTAHASAHNTIEAMRLGAFDHLTKPIGRDDLSRVLTDMLAAGRDRSVAQPDRTEDGLVGSSEAMRAIQKSIGRLADSGTTVLITGETGTGKELVARALHEHGVRAHHPFIAVNCAAIPTELMETELFGHVKGAFSGATRDRLGAFREAAGGTLFLDEIGDMDAAMQAKILRALQERIVTPVGGAPAAVDARIVAATHRNLSERVAAGEFREDLYYRLNVVPIHLPALRERLADIVPLAEHFLARAGGAKRLTAAAAASLIRQPWPGNVRELKNTMDRLNVTVHGNLVDASHLSAADNGKSDSVAMLDWPEQTLPAALQRLERFLIRRALAACAENRAEAARVLGIHRQLLYAKMKRLGMDVPDDQAEKP